MVFCRYEIENATAVALTFNSSVTGSNVPAGFVERFIHSEIYKAFPDVQGVVHGHTNEVLPFAGANVPLTAQMHTVGLLCLFLSSNRSLRVFSLGWFGRDAWHSHLRHKHTPSKHTSSRSATRSPNPKRGPRRRPCASFLQRQPGTRSASKSRSRRL